MTSFLGILEAYIFTGITGNTAYDLIKSGWVAITNKSWEQLYIDAFQSAIEEQRENLAKYTDNGDIHIDTSHIRKALHQDLDMPIDLGTMTALTDDQFANRLSKALYKREALIIGGNNLSEFDYASLVNRLVQLAVVSFKRSILSNDQAFREAVLKEAEGNQETLRIIEGLLVSKFNLIFHDLQDIKETLHEIRRLLTIDRPKDVIADEIGVLATTYPSGLTFCDEYPHEVLSDKYFIAQEFNNNQSALRTSIEKALRQLDVDSIRADDFIWGGPILCKISSLILGTPFGVYQLSESQNRNVYLELGIAMGMGKPFVLVKDRTAKVADLIRGIEYYQINSYLETSYKLGNLLQKFVANIGNFRPRKPIIPSSSQTAVIAHGDLEHIDIGVTIAKQLAKHNYLPVFLGNVDEKLSRYLDYEGVFCSFAVARDEIVSAIQTSSLGVYRVDKTASADTFVELGIAMGLNRPFFLVTNSRSEIPSDLNGLSSVSFHGFTDLETKFNLLFPNWLEKMDLLPE